MKKNIQVKSRSYVLVTIIICLLGILCACGDSESSGSSVEWPDTKIGNMLPETSAKATNVSINEDYIWADLQMKKDEYKSYVDAFLK